MAQHFSIPEKKLAIVNAAVVLMDEYGLSGFTMQELCDEAGVSIGTFYHYFSSKDDIPAEIHALLCAHLLAQKNDFLKDPDWRVNLAVFAQEFSTFVLHWGYHANQLILYHSLNSDTDYSLRSSSTLNLLIEEIIIQTADQSNISEKAAGITQDILIIIRGILLDWAKAPADFAYPLVDNILRLITAYLTSYTI